MTDLTLSTIRLYGLMQGNAWGGFVAEYEFDKRFTVRRSEYLSGIVRGDTWLGIDEALQKALTWGDVIGGQGSIAWGFLEFCLTRREGRRFEQRNICVPLESIRKAQRYMAASS